MSTEPHSDLTRVFPELAEIRDLAVALDYTGLATRLLTLHDRDERLLTDAASVAIEQPGTHEMLRGRLAQQDDDILARALWAHSLIVRGWDIRTDQLAAQVSDEQFEQFHDHLREAEAALIELCAVEPGWSYPWWLRLISARGLELGASETRRRYDRLAELNPHHHPGQTQLLQSLCPKWGGTWEEAFAFARSCVAAAPGGSPVHGLIADAHLEHWVTLDDRDRHTYARQPDVLAEVRTAAMASVFHADHVPDFSWASLHSAFGALLALGGDEAGAAHHFAALRDVVDGGVWSYLGSSRPVVERARRAGLAMVGAA